MIFLFNFRYGLAGLIDDIVLIIPVQAATAGGSAVYLVVGRVRHYDINVDRIAGFNLIFLRADCYGEWFLSCL